MQFIDNVGLVTDWSSLGWNTAVPQPNTSTMPGAGPDEGLIIHDPDLATNVENFTPSLESSLVRHGHIADGAAGQPVSWNPLDVRWTLTNASMQNLSQRLAQHVDLMPLFQLPSRLALSRYIQGFFEQFHRHIPMIHVATWDIETSPPALTLIIAALGATYRFEGSKSVALYRASRMLVQDQVWLKRKTEEDTGSDITITQILILLMCFAAWDHSTQLLDEALALQTHCAEFVRKIGLQEDQIAAGPDAEDWLDWVRQEERRRTKLTAYAYLVIQSSVYNLPPVLLPGEVEKFPLPCPAELWDARSAQEWQLAKEYSLPHSSETFGTALRCLLDTRPGEEAPKAQLSAYARFILLQALIQRTFMLRQLQMSPDDSLEAAHIKQLESALRRWQTTWTPTVESALDPTNVDGPLPFDSAAFLSLAYSRVYISLGPHRNLESRDPHEVARSLLGSPKLERSPALTTALLHATHQLSLPVHIGIEYVCRSQMLFWSCQHAFCALEPAVLLWKWLQAIEDSNDLSNKEVQIAAWIRALVAEALQTVEPAKIGLDEHITIEALPTSALGIAVLKIWAITFSGNSMWPIIELITESLNRLVEMVVL